MFPNEGQNHYLSLLVALVTTGADMGGGGGCSANCLISAVFVLVNELRMTEGNTGMVRMYIESFKAAIKDKGNLLIKK
jgi:hypothetical protein